MKKLLFILFLFTCFASFGQSPGNDTSRYIWSKHQYGIRQPRMKSDTVQDIPRDTMYSKDGIARIGNKFFTGNGIYWREIGMTELDGIESGGLVSWDSLLVFSITSAVYWINGVQYTSVAQSLTLNPADPTNPRIDVFALDNTGTFVAVEGVASTPPVEPQTDPATQLYRAFAQIDAGATTPTGVTSEIIYDENIEWTTTTGAGLTVNYNDVSTPFHLVKDADVGTWATTRTITFTHTGVLSRNDYTLLKMYINLKAALPSTANIQVYFLNGTTQITPTTNLGPAHGFSKTGVGYQNVTVQLSTLAFSGSDFTKVVIRFTGVGSGIYLDWVQLQGGVVNGSTNFITDVYRISGTTNVMKVINGVSTLAFVDSVSTGSGGVSTAVDSIWRTGGQDSIKFSIAGRLRSIKDSSGGVHFSGAGVDSVILYSNTICIYYTTDVDTCFMLDKAYTHVTRNHDTTMYLAYNGGILIDSFQIYYTKIFAGTNMVIRDTTLPSGETGYILDASGSGISGGISELGAGYGLTIVNDSTYDVDSAVIVTRARLIDELALKQDVLTLTTTGSSGAATLVGATLNIPQYSGGGTTIYETETASGSTTFTFTTVPAAYDDYIIFVNGAKIRSTTDYTTSGDIVTIPTIVSGDIVEYQRLK